jgi:cyclin D1/2/4
MCNVFTDSRFLSFRPSEIAAAVVLAVLAENQFLVFNSALGESEIPVNKVSLFLHFRNGILICHCIFNVSECVMFVHPQEMVMRCYELMVEKALVKKIRNSNASSSVPHSPITVLDAACFSFRSDDTTLGSSQSNSNNKDYNSQDSAPASKRRRLNTTPI